MTKIALTFDAEFPDQSTWSRNDPHDDTAKICDALYQYSIPATFFVQGRWAQSNPLAVQRIADGGFTVGSHGFYHAPYPMLTANGARADVEQTHELLTKLTGVEPELFRYPYGSVGHKSTVQSLDYEVVGWDFTPEDWTLDDWQILGKRMQDASGIVLLHTWPAPVSAHLKQVIAPMLNEGIEFVKLEEI